MFLAWLWMKTDTTMSMRLSFVVSNRNPITRSRRLGSEVQDPSPQEPADRLTEGAPRGTRTTLRNNKDDYSSESGSEEGGLLGLLLDDDSKEAIRKGRENLRVISSGAPEQSRKDGEDESPRQQTSREGTAEVTGTAVRTARTEPMPVSDHVAASPPVVTDGAARSFTPATPSSSLRQEGAATIPTPTAERQHVSIRPSRSPAPRPPLATKVFDSSYNDR